MINQQIKAQTNNIFVQKEVDINNPAVIASIVTAAASMSDVADVDIQKDVVISQLLGVYEKNDDEMISNLIGLGPQYVRGNIGFATDFNDYSAARATYESQKDLYDQYYTNILARAKATEIQTKQM